MKRIELGRLECSFRTELGCLAKVLLVLGDMKKTLKVTGRANLITVFLRKVILAVTRRMLLVTGSNQEQPIVKKTSVIVLQEQTSKMRGNNEIIVG